MKSKNLEQWILWVWRGDEEVVNLMEFFLLDHLMKSMSLGQFWSWVGTSGLGRGDEDLVNLMGG